jgi:hypothetical protein
MQRAVGRGLCALLLLTSLGSLAPEAMAGDRADKREIVRQARAAHYSLRLQGLDSFESTVSPNWEVVLSVEREIENKAETMRLLNGLHFAMSLDARGKVAVTHRADVAAANETVQKGYDQIFGGMEQVVSGFFATWGPFVLTTPFPPVAGEYQLEDFEDGYRLTWMEGTARVVSRLTRKLNIVETSVNGPGFDSTIRPTFASTEQGFVLAGYVADYKPKSGTGVTHLAAVVEHQVVDGLRVPRRVSFDSNVDGTPNKTEVVFSEYVIKRR